MVLSIIILKSILVITFLITTTEMCSLTEITNSGTSITNCEKKALNKVLWSTSGAFIEEMVLHDNINLEVLDMNFSRFSSLKYLTLNNNNIKMVNVDFLFENKQLVKLKIQEPSLILNNSVFMSNESDLMYLHLEIFKITEKSFNSLPKNIMEIVIDNTFITDTKSLSMTHKYPQLKFLTLNNCSLEDIVLDPSGNTLTHLAVVHNRLEANIHHLGRLVTLLDLNLSFNRIFHVTEMDFRNMPAIIHLNLSNNRIILIEKNSFQKNKNLEVLDLSNNNLHTIDLNIRVVSSLEIAWTGNNLCRHLRNSEYGISIETNNQTDEPFNLKNSIICNQSKSIWPVTLVSVIISLVFTIIGIHYGIQKCRSVQVICENDSFKMREHPTHNYYHGLATQPSSVEEDLET